MRRKGKGESNKEDQDQHPFVRLSFFLVLESVFIAPRLVNPPLNLIENIEIIMYVLHLGNSTFISNLTLLVLTNAPSQSCSVDYIGPLEMFTNTYMHHFN